MKIKILLILIVILLNGCRSKKVTTDIQRENTTEKTREVSNTTDTVFKDRVIIKTLPVYSEVTIEAPCDSLGKIRPINTLIGSGGNRSQINTVNGQLIIRQYIDSTKQQNELILKLQTRLDSVTSINSTLKENNFTKEVRVFVWPWWLYAIIIGFVLYVGLTLYLKFLP